MANQERWTDDSFGPINKTLEERERIAKRDAEIAAVREELRRAAKSQDQGSRRPKCGK